MKSKVAVVPCESYEEKQVYEAIEKGIAFLGGWERFLKQDEKILLKPNLLNRAEAGKAVTTNPAVFEAVIKSLKDKGYDKADAASEKDIPVYDYRKCIRCYCCQEMCPEKAIIVKRKLI